MKRHPVKGLVMGLGIVCIVLGATGAQADNIYVSIKGAKQGPFKGEVQQKGFEGKIAGLKFRYDIMSPRDIATGQPTGKRQHKPVTITKDWGAASPQLFQAMVTNEVLSEVVIDFVGVDPRGMPALTHKIKLVNASVSNISHFADVLDKGGRHLEDVSFTFQKIELEDSLGKTMAMDSWLAP